MRIILFLHLVMICQNDHKVFPTFLDNDYVIVNWLYCLHDWLMESHTKVPMTMIDLHFTTKIVGHHKWGLGILVGLCGSIFVTKLYIRRTKILWLRNDAVTSGAQQLACSIHFGYSLILKNDLAQSMHGQWRNQVIGRPQWHGRG